MLVPALCIDLTGDERFHDLDVRRLLVELREQERARLAISAACAQSLARGLLRSLAADERCESTYKPLGHRFARRCPNAAVGPLWRPPLVQRMRRAARPP